MVNYSLLITHYGATRSYRKKTLLSVAAVLLFIVFGLPYLLPLNRPATVDPETLIDPNGAFVQAGDTRMYYQNAGLGEVGQTKRPIQ